MTEKIMLNPAYMLTKVGDENVLLPCDDIDGIDMTEIIVLNDIAFDIISYIEKSPATRKDLFSYLYGLYEVAEDELNADIDTFISCLDEKHALVRKI